MQPFIKLKNAVIPKNNDHIKNALSGIIANDLKFLSINSVERIK